jgi:Ser/Thr protein kinase RdoA (MazF antagonist)
MEAGENKMKNRTSTREHFGNKDSLRKYINALPNPTDIRHFRVLSIRTNGNVGLKLMTDRGNFFYKIYYHVNPISLQRVMEIQNYYYSKGYPSSKPLMFEEGYVLAVSQEIFATMSEFIEGKSQFNAKSFEEISRYMAEFHKIGANCRLTLKDCLRSYNPQDIFNYLDQKITNSIEESEHILGCANDRQLIHGDMHHGHFLFSEDKVVAILDFEKMGYGLREEDIGSTIFYMLANSKRQDMSFRIISTYDKYSDRPIRPHLLKAGILKTASGYALWRAHEYKKRASLSNRKEYFKSLKLLDLVRELKL